MPIARRVALVTGSSDGLGRAVALRLAQSGYRVLVHGRSRQKGADTLRHLRSLAGGAPAEFHCADFSCLDAVRRFARDIVSTHQRLHLLINNAGVGFGPPRARRQQSRDGHELRFAVNYLAPFLLTHLLLPLLVKSAPARIVNVASSAQSPIDFGDPMLRRSYDGRRAYGQSKLALILFTLDLAHALKGTGVSVNAIHPASYMETNMVLEAGVAPQRGLAEGADALLRLAAAPQLESVSGLFFDGPEPSLPRPQAYDMEARRRLRLLSAQLCGLSAASAAPAACGVAR